MTLVTSVNLSEKTRLMFHIRFHPEICIKINFHPWLGSMTQTRDCALFFEHGALIMLKRLLSCEVF